MRKLPLIFAFVALIALLGSQYFRARAPLATVTNTPIAHEAKPKPGPETPGNPGPGETEAAKAPAENSSVIDTMQVAISVVVLGAGLFVVLSKKYEAAEKNWAFGAIGTVVGFWLKL